MNKAILIGNLANDPETRTTASGVTMCQFRLACLLYTSRNFQTRFGYAQIMAEPVV